MAPDAESYASPQDMKDWARSLMMMRSPDQIIGEDYLRRWFLTPRSPGLNVYLHQILRSDEDRALHDHPWDNCSLIISGSYIEHMPDGASVIRGPGDSVSRRAEDLHRLELINDEPVISLFTTGAKRREWGFACPGGWVHWKDFTANPERYMVPVEQAA